MTQFLIFALVGGIASFIHAARSVAFLGIGRRAVFWGYALMFSAAFAALTPHDNLDGPQSLGVLLLATLYTLTWVIDHGPDWVVVRAKSQGSSPHAYCLAACARYGAASVVLTIAMALVAVALDTPFSGYAYALTGLLAGPIAGGLMMILPEEKAWRVFEPIIGALMTAPLALIP